MSLRDRILTAQDTTHELVDIPEWGVQVEVRSMSGAARAAIVQTGVSGQVDMARLMPEIIVMCTFDPETGEQVFTADDKALVMDKNGSALEKIMTVAMRLSGFTQNAVDDAGKGFLSTPSGGSSSS